jgi:hypothetical protein
MSTARSVMLVLSFFCYPHLCFSQNSSPGLNGADVAGAASALSF